MSFSESEIESRTNDGFGESVFTKMIKAGHRTYFIDVKTKFTEGLSSVVEYLKQHTAK